MCIKIPRWKPLKNLKRTFLMAEVEKLACQKREDVIKADKKIFLLDLDVVLPTSFSSSADKTFISRCHLSLQASTTPESLIWFRLYSNSRHLWASFEIQQMCLSAATHPRLIISSQSINLRVKGVFSFSVGGTLFCLCWDFRSLLKTAQVIKDCIHFPPKQSHRHPCNHVLGGFNHTQNDAVIVATMN